VKPVKFLFKLLFLGCCASIIILGCAFSNLTPNGVIANAEISQIAKSVTVRLFNHSRSVNGSGIIIMRNKNNYFILTNEHVVESSFKNDILIQTPDNKIYNAYLISYPFEKNDDLALLKIKANKEYSFSNLGNFKKTNIGDTIYSVGFTIDPENSNIPLTLTKGVVSMITKPLIGGYQIGYTNDVEPGMSGGPILNQHGEIIGINGIRKSPSLGDPFTFTDGSIIPDKIWKQMINLSWGIPINRFTKLKESYLDPGLFHSKERFE